MRITYSKTLTASVGAVALVAVGGVATASAAQDPAEATANLIDEVSPDQGAQLEVNLPKEITTQDADGPHEFTDTFGDDITPVLADDGTVELRQTVQDGVVIAIGTVDKPWAADANGAAVPTNYSVRGGARVGPRAKCVR
ncbi:hypothetical protein [Isoptericola sp. NPDC057191]|uniref:hypothetical protein n=1 Tax=Isoptericola sp. NPDC057191 TaxID=3346041 RepID=UPI00363A29E7